MNTPNLSKEVRKILQDSKDQRLSNAIDKLERKTDELIFTKSGKIKYGNGND